MVWDYKPDRVKPHALLIAGRPGEAVIQGTRLIKWSAEPLTGTEPAAEHRRRAAIFLHARISRRVHKCV